MELITFINPFVAIVGLIGQFVSGRKQADFNDFLKWLVEENHGEIKKLIEKNTEATSGIKSLFSDKTDIILTKLETLDKALVSFSSCISGFSEIGKAIKPQDILSDQAISILKQLDESGKDKIVTYTNGMDLVLSIIDNPPRNVNIKNQRFLEDDLQKLVYLKLLLLKNTPKSGDRVYIITRAASLLVREKRD